MLAVCLSLSPHALTHLSLARTVSLALASRICFITLSLTPSRTRARTQTHTHTLLTPACTHTHTHSLTHTRTHTHTCTHTEMRVFEWGKYWREGVRDPVFSLHRYSWTQLRVFRQAEYFLPSWAASCPHENDELSV